MPPTPAPIQQPVYAPSPQQPVAPMPLTPAPTSQQLAVQQSAYAGQQAYTQTSTTTTTTTSSANIGYAGQSQTMSQGYQPQTAATNYGQLQQPHQAPQLSQAPLQITQGQSPAAVNYGPQSQMTQPQMTYPGQAGPYNPKLQSYPPQTPAPQHLLPAGQPGSYRATPGPSQQQQSVGHYGQPLGPQGYLPAPTAHQSLGYDQSQQPAYSQELVPGSGVVKPPKEKQSKKSSSSKKEKKDKQ
ncbi:hypothetical protein LTR85_011170 [Meristemomyces frigidus]|nr:hypothetical protein LTR85_011170 [Meristemomyces frigidus]